MDSAIWISEPTRYNLFIFRLLSLTVSANDVG